MDLVSAEALSDGARWSLFIAFALAALEKATILRAGPAAWHPMMLRSPFRRKHATGLIATSLAADLAALMLLGTQPETGALWSIGLVITYTIAAPPVASANGDECRCFWKVLNTTTRLGLATRNTLLLLLASLVFVVGPRPSIFSALLPIAFLPLVHAAGRVADGVDPSAGTERPHSGSAERNARRPDRYRPAPVHQREGGV